jgi:hypothetical protein
VMMRRYDDLLRSLAGCTTDKETTSP